MSFNPSLQTAVKQVEEHIKDFNFASKTKKLQIEWIIELNRLLKIFRQARGR